MSIIINEVRPIDDKIQLCLLTISYKEKEYKYLSNSPVLFGDELQKYINSIENRCVLSILRQMYRDAPNDLTDLDKWEQWIKDGCEVQVPDGIDKDGKPKFKVAQVVPSEFKGTHPPEDKVAKLEERIKALELR